MSGKIEMPVAVITDVAVIFHGQRKPTWFEVRADLVTEMASVSSDDAPLCAVATLQPRPGDGVYSARPGRGLEYRNLNGRMFTTKSYHHLGEDERPVDEATLRRIMAAHPDDPPPYSQVFGRDTGSAVRNGYRFSSVRRHEMPTLAQVTEGRQVKEIVEDGMAAANRQVMRLVEDYALVDGVLQQRTTGPCWTLFKVRDREWQVTVPIGLAGSKGAHLFDPRRVDDAEAMAAWLGKRDRKGTAARIDAIEFVDESLFVLDEPALVMKHGMDDVWSGFGELLHGLPGDVVARWVAFRDIEVAVRGGKNSRAVEAMAAFRDLVEGVRAADLKPYYDDKRSVWLRLAADAIHRIVDIELPRLGVRPGERMAAPDEDAMAALAP